MDNNSVKIQGYTIFLDKKLGQGAYGKIYIAQKDDTLQICAAKLIDKKLIDYDYYLKDAIFQQIEILKLLKSPNVVGFHNIIESPQYYYIIQQYCDGGDLQGLLKKRKNINQSQAIQMLKQICNGFISLIKEGIIHRDLKPENILIHQGILKIADFGFSKRLKNRRLKTQSVVGTPLYMCLELLKGQPYTSKCDIWALGLIFYQLLVGEYPWEVYTEYQLIQSIENSPLKYPANLSNKSISFLKKCLQGYQQNRFSWDQLLCHPIFEGCFNEFIKQKQGLENKFKAVMNKLKFKIQSENIDLERLFQEKGYSKNSNLNFQEFEQFIMTVDSNISDQQKRYIFEKIDKNDSNHVEYSELEDALKQNKIPMRSKKFELKQSHQKEINQNSLELKKQFSKKIHQTFDTLINKMKQKNYTLMQFFQQFDIKKNGLLKKKHFERFILKLQKSYSNSQLQLIYNMIDINNSGQISFEEFHQFFCKITGEPIYNFMNKNKNIRLDNLQKGKSNKKQKKEGKLKNDHSQMSNSNQSGNSFSNHQYYYQGGYQPTGSVSEKKRMEKKRNESNISKSSEVGFNNGHGFQGGYNPGS